MAAQLQLEAVARRDTNGDLYYFTTPRLPCLVNLADVVIFIRPRKDSDGEDSHAEIAIKSYQGKSKSDEGR